MSYALHFLFVVPYEIRRLWQFGHEVVDGVNPSYGFQQEQERAQRQVVGRAAFKLVYGNG